MEVMKQEKMAVGLKIGQLVNDRQDKIDKLRGHLKHYQCKLSEETTTSQDNWAAVAISAIRDLEKALELL
jgi:hypothetical protein